MTLDRALAEATSSYLADLRKSAGEFQSDADRFNEALKTTRAAALYCGSASQFTCSVVCPGGLMGKRALGYAVYIGDDRNGKAN